MHRSQGMGAGQRKGHAPAFFGHVAGEKADRDLFEDIDLTWGRVPGGAEIGELLAKAREQFRVDDPQAILPLLIQAYTAMGKIEHPWVELKKTELLRAIELAAGLWIDASAERWNVTAGSEVELTLSVLDRSGGAWSWLGTEIRGVARATAAPPPGPLIHDRPTSKKIALSIPSSTPYSQPAWLHREVGTDFYSIHDPALIGQPESPPPLQADFRLRGPRGAELTFTKPVLYRWVDRAFGERTRLVQVVPKVAVSFERANLIFPDADPRKAAVRLQSNAADIEGQASLEAPAGWTVEPRSAPFALAREGQELTLRFQLHPPATASGGTLVARVEVGGRVISSGVRTIEYPHIPIQVVYPKALMRVERTDVKLLSKNIGYVMGSGDKVPEALEQLGATVTLLSAKDLAAGDLSRFETLILGIRALNTRPDLLGARERVLQYVEAGGALIVQYNTVWRRRDAPTIIAPYPLTPSQNRVSLKEAPVRLLDPKHPLLQGPNRITENDFRGWVQERGLYFMGEWDERYQTILGSNDPGEDPRQGGLLYARYGKGVYIFTGYSWFRQLPAGVPGAYRIFANLVSAGKTR
jgi:hypothetical protein